MCRVELCTEPELTLSSSYPYIFNIFLCCLLFKNWYGKVTRSADAHKNFYNPLDAQPLEFSTSLLIHFYIAQQPVSILSYELIRHDNGNHHH